MKRETPIGSPSAMEMGARIEYLRKKHEMTRQELGDRLGVQPAAIYKWERGINSPMLVNSVRMADIFGVTLDELLGRSG